jgi:cell shape-determining protein MreC
MKFAAMSGLSEIVDSLESKLDMLARRLEHADKANKELESERSNSAALIHRQAEEIAVLKQQNESLKMANSLLGSDDNKRDTKLRINSLIREIDYCIAQLSD